CRAARPEDESCGKERGKHDEQDSCGDDHVSFSPRVFGRAGADLAWPALILPATVVRRRTAAAHVPGLTALTGGIRQGPQHDVEHADRAGLVERIVAVS